MRLPRTRVALFLAVRSLARGNAGVSAMAVAMMAAIFVSVMFLPSLIGGASTRLNSQVVDTLTGDLTILPTGTTSIDHVAPYLTDVRATDGVRSATAVRRVGNQISHGDITIAQGIDAIDPTSYAEVFSTPGHLIEGDFLQPGDAEGIVLGVGAAGADRTDLRTYGGSLKTVHAGDEVEVGLVGGETHTFVVRGVYQNDFPLSDLGALVTTEAADRLASGDDLSARVRDMFAAIDELSGALGKAGDQAEVLADGTSALLTGAAQLAVTSRDLATGTGDLAGGADRLRTSARALAGSADELADAADKLAAGLRTTDDQLAGPAVAVAGSAATKTAAVASGAGSLAQSCPPGDPAFCAAVAQHAQLAGEAAGVTAASESATTQMADAVGTAADSAEALAARLRRLADAADRLADAAGRQASGTTRLADGATELASAADELAGRTDDVAKASSALARGLRDGARVDTPDRASRDDLLATLDSAGDPPGRHAATRVVLRTDPGTTSAALEERLAPLRDGVDFQDPSQLASAIQDQLDTFELINNIMRVISLLVAAITVLIITYIDLTNRRRQIGIERAIGIRSSAIVGSYIVKSMITALVGTALGWLLFRTVIVPYVDRHPFHFPNGDVTLGVDPATVRANVVILLTVAALAAALPAIRTVRMRILDAIWGS